MYLVHSEKKEKEKSFFDTTAFRYFEININDIKASQARLHPAIEKAHKMITEGIYDKNPVTRFFEAPLTAISPAHGLALGYFNNFVIRIFPFLKKQWKKLRIVIPNRLIHCTTQSIEVKLVNPEIIKEVSYKPKKSREISLYMVPNDQEHLYDIPTTMYSMSESVKNRMSSKDLSHTSEEYKQLESDAINQFKSILAKFIVDREVELPDIADWVEIYDWNYLFK